MALAFEVQDIPSSVLVLFSFPCVALEGRIQQLRFQPFSIFLLQSSAEAGGDKAKWIDEIIPTLRNSFPLMKGLVWFDVNKEADWRISSSPASEAAFIRMANDPYFNP